MRCNFFRRILALFLIGTMLSYVGCKTMTTTLMPFVKI